MTDGRTAAAVVAAALVLVAALGSTPVAAATYEELGDPTVETTVQGSDVLAPGESRTLTVGLRNTGVTVTSWDGRVSDLAAVIESQGIQPGAAVSTTARVRAGEAPLDVRTGPQSVGTVAADTDARVPVRVEVDENATPGVYRLPVEVHYRYVETIIVNANEHHVVRNEQTVTRHVTVRVEPRARLSVVSTAGEGLTERSDGRLSVTVRNSGTETATNAVLRMRSDDDLIPRTNGAGLGDLRPGETATARFRVGVGDVASAVDRAVGFSLRYETENGAVRETPTRTGRVGIVPGPEFDLSAAAESLYVDSTGAVRLTVTNVGDAPAPDARVQIADSGTLAPLTDGASLGRLGPDESATVRFRIEVADRALAGSYPLGLVVVHDDSFGEAVESDRLTVPVTVGPERTIRTGSATDLRAGATGTVTFTVTNTGPGPMRDAVVRLNADSPFETDDDTAYVGDLAPGESAEVSFTVSVDGAATPKRYTLDTTVTYDNAFDRRVVTDVESTAVRVTAGGGGVIATILDVLGL